MGVGASYDIEECKHRIKPFPKNPLEKGQKQGLP